ncbi:Gfo/Idh/MocA family protein [Neobacillus sp. SM06]|uniref:Gfo/Idh/MocA family protein n=1 Tax=Neobacillus sp. SM06 TaxID=3422492 RepID=UPI003D2727D3
MIKVGVIGLGNIAQKAYLPIYAAIDDVEFHLYTPNQQKAAAIARKYRISHVYASLESLIQSGIKAAFVHSSTETHDEVVRALLTNGIHVFVDKPITDHYETSKALVELAEQEHLLLRIGFNRRFAPGIQQLKEVKKPNMVVVEKHRASKPKDVRTFIFDDFIHVVDTIRYLFPYPIEEVIVRGTKNNELLSNVTVQLISKQGIAMGIMNRESGSSEEKAEVMSANEKRTALNLANMVISTEQTQTEVRFGDWETTLNKRGFEAMVKDFLDTIAIQQNAESLTVARDALETHRLCEEITQQLEGQN